MRNPLKIFWILLGFLCLGLGTIGIVLPILPTVPFYDAWNQMQDHWHGDCSHGHRIYLHEKCTCGKDLYRDCVGMPHSVFLPQGKNCGAGGVSNQ